MCGAVHATLVRGGGQGAPCAVVRHGGDLGSATLPTDLVAAVPWNKSYRLRLVERDREADPAEHLLWNLLSGLHLSLTIGRLQAVGLVEHGIDLLLALILL